MNLTNEHKQFFSLLRSGLWGYPADSTLFNNKTNWNKLFDIAKKQSSIGIVYDGILTLPNELRPPRSFFLQWTIMVAKIEEDNEHLNDELLNVFSLYRQNGLTPILLKGQGVAQNYPNPYRRQCGDIDLYVGEVDFEKSNGLLRPESTREHEENNKHTSMVWHGVTIENHRIMTHLNQPSSNRFLQKSIKEWFPNNARSISINGTGVSVAPLEFDIAYVLIHAVLHFLNEGIGLRQVQDWVCLLNANKNILDKNKLIQLLKGTGLIKAARIFGALSVDYLGLSPDVLPFSLTPKDHKLAMWLLNDIMQGGNFGKYYDDREKRPNGYWAGKWYTFRRNFSRCKEMGRIAPGEARWYPFFLAVASAKTQIKKRLGIKL